MVWNDWDQNSPICPPQPPNQGVNGIVRARKEADRIVEQWGKFEPISKLKKVTKISYPDELDSKKSYFEGAKKSVVVNSYERSNDARKKCLKKHGYSCAVCDFDFGSFYGEFANKYIHVHHLVPLHVIGKEYKINPEEDLIPVCPNCHAVIHMSKSKPYTVAELKAIIKKK